ncbi:hypothetical protein VH570_19775 [Sphingobium sp. HT1-2]|uniref:hypothetical protein n=1 Tax=Sphingobium sp. HT1-2 TaxID=3111640 RepID=UPI003C047B70
MVDRPILFSAPMVRALIDGRKTQTRRIAKFIEQSGHQFHVHNAHGGWFGPECRVADVATDYAPFAVGDRLWVKETWRAGRGYDDVRPRDMAHFSRIWFEADGCNDNADAIGRKARPSIFMPRWASRLTLVVTDVRVERLQACSEADALAEGAYRGKASGRIADNQAAMCLGDWFASARGWYADLWDRINGLGAWEANPWVIAVSFNVRKGNIDD